jgi:cyclase
MKAACTPSILLFLVPLLTSLMAFSAFAESDVTKTYEKVKVADGIYAFIAAEPKSPIVSGNSVAVIGDDGVLVVDSGHFPSLTRRMIADIRQMTNQPVRVLVNTHWHPDHMLGNAEYRKAFPGIVILSTPNTREEADRQVPTTYIKGQLDELPNDIKAFQHVLDTGRDDDGKPLSAHDRQYCMDVIADAREFIPELEQAKYEPPSETFDQNVAFYLGKREVRVMFLGRGNTGGDAVIYVPDSKVLITGDLVVNPTPYAYGSFLSEWVETLKKLESIDATTVIPGHGSIERDKEYIKQVQALLASTTAQVRQAVQQGLSLEETHKKVDLSSFRQQMAGDDPKWKQAFSVAYETPAVERAYREAKEGPLHDEN